MTDCEMCTAEAGRKGLIEQARFSFFMEKDNDIIVQNLCSACLKRMMLIATRDIKKEVKVIVKLYDDDDEEILNTMNSM